jgi:hypothetical protein
VATRSLVADKAKRRAVERCSGPAFMLRIDAATAPSLLLSAGNQASATPDQTNGNRPLRELDRREFHHAGRFT